MSATHTSEMDAEDQKDIINKVKTAGEGDEPELDTEPEDVDVSDVEDVDGDVDVDTEVGVDEATGGNIFLKNPKKNNMFQPHSNDVLGESFDFNKVSIESASGDKVVKRDEDDYGNPLYWSLTNDYVNYYIGSDEEIVKYNGKTGERYSIGNLKDFDTSDRIDEQGKSQNYMFWQNLKTINHASGEMLGMDQDKVDSILNDGHGWAVDHISTSSDDMEEVYHFLEAKLDVNLDNSEKSSIFDKSIIKSKLEETFNQDDKMSEPMIEPAVKPAPVTEPKTKPNTPPSRKNKPFLPMPSVKPDPKAVKEDISKQYEEGDIVKVKKANIYKIILDVVIDNKISEVEFERAELVEKPLGYDEPWIYMFKSVNAPDGKTYSVNGDLLGNPETDLQFSQVSDDSIELVG